MEGWPFKLQASFSVPGIGNIDHYPAKKAGTLTKNNWEIWRKNFANSVTCKGLALSVVLLSGRIITCEITGKSKSKRRSGSKVHCLYKTKVSKQITQNVELLINEYLERTEYPISKLL